MAKRGQWETFLRFYVAGSSTDVNACFHAWALHRTGETDAALAAAEQLWLVPESQPDECDPIFRVLRESSLLTPALAWARFELAIRAGETKLANYLVRFLDDSGKRFANQWLQVRRDPAQLRRTGSYRDNDPRVAKLVLYGLRRLSRSDPVKALDLLKVYEAWTAFDEQEKADAIAYMGRQLAWDDDPDGRLDDLPVDLAAYPDLIDARVRLALRESQFPDALVLINRLPDDVRERNVWQFWTARILTQSIDPADQSRAREILGALAQTRSFYGFLAADELGQPYNFVDDPEAITEEEILALAASPGIQRALELLALGERTRARREWYFVTSNFSRRERQIAAHVAARWGWHKSAIQSLIDAKAWNEIDLRFPFAWRETFTEHARYADIPPYWNIAVARQESAFMPDARSHAGARGLMQLMPATARLVARQTGTRLESERELSDPVLNISLGSQYLGQMLRRYNNNRVLASAAYNAGPGRVDRWLNPDLPLEVWVETIPFRETRNYVQNVLMFAAIYAHRMKQPQPLIYANEYQDFSNRLAAANPESP